METVKHFKKIILKIMKKLPISVDMDEATESTIRRSMVWMEKEIKSADVRFNYAPSNESKHIKTPEYFACT